MAWEVLDGSQFSDGKSRQIQWTTRIQNPGPPYNLLTLSQFVGRGSSSVGRLAINPNVRHCPPRHGQNYFHSSRDRKLIQRACQMSIQYAEIPYFQTDDDKKACVIAGERMVAALKANPDISLVKPASNQTVAEYVDSVSEHLLAESGPFVQPTTIYSTMSGPIRYVANRSFRLPSASHHVADSTSWGLREWEPTAA